MTVTFGCIADNFARRAWLREGPGKSSVHHCGVGSAVPGQTFRSASFPLLRKRSFSAFDEVPDLLANVMARLVKVTGYALRSVARTLADQGDRLAQQLAHIVHVVEPRRSEQGRFRLGRRARRPGRASTAQGDVRTLVLLAEQLSGSSLSFAGPCHRSLVTWRL